MYCSSSLCLETTVTRSDKVCRVETNTKLTNHGDIGTCSESLHKLLGARSCDRTEVVDEILKIVSRAWNELIRRLLTALVMPIPVSRMVRVLFSLSGIMSIRRSFPVSSLLESERASYRILSRASEQLETSSRRKISLLE